MAVPGSLTCFLDQSMAEVAAAIMAGELALSPDQIDAVASELALGVEAEGTRLEILDAAIALHELAEWVRDAERDALRLAARWEMLAEHLTDRATRSGDPVSLAALMRSDDGLPRRVLEMLAASPSGTLPATDFLVALDLSGPHLAHLLRSIHDADLIHRHLVGQSVMVTLARRGRGVIGADPAPPEPRFAPGTQAMIDELPPHRRRQVLDRPRVSLATALFGERGL